MDTAIADHLVLPLGQDLGIADDHGPGRTFLKAPSAHGTQTMTPRDGDTFIAERGAILSGAIVLPLGDFHRMKVCTSSTAKHSRTRRQWIGDVEAGTKGNRRTTTTSRKFTILRSSSPTETARHVNTLEDVNQPGTRFFDYEADRIGMYDDPASCDQVERSVGEYAFAGAGTTDVTLGDLTVPRYANRAQNGAISGAGGRDWAVRFVESAYNHGAGIPPGNWIHAHKSQFVFNGQIRDHRQRRHAGGEQQPAHNCQLGFEQGWKAGGMKFARTSKSSFKTTGSTAMLTPKGIWFDIDNIDAVIPPISSNTLRSPASSTRSSTQPRCTGISLDAMRTR